MSRNKVNDKYMQLFCNVTIKQSNDLIIEKIQSEYLSITLIKKI